MSEVKRIIKIIAGSDVRSKNMTKNSIIMLISKGITILIGFFLLPLTVGYVDSETYGIWVTISSMAAWLSIFDIGLGNGLKNKFVEFRAKEDNFQVQKYVSTTYAMLCFIFVPLLCIFLIINPFINWETILNVHTEENLHLVFAIVIGYFSLNFIFSTINTILIADQKPGDSSIRTVIQQVCILLTIIVLTNITDGSLVKLCIALCVIPLLIIIAFNITLFFGRYYNIRPRLHSVDFSLLNGLLKLSLKFFYLQSVALILFQLTNFLIIHYFSASDVTLYNVAYRYFTMPTGFFAAISTPIWAAVAEALTLRDNTWVCKSLKKYTYVLGLFVAGELLMLLLAQPIYHIWMGDKISEIPFLVSFLCMLSACITMSTNVYVNALCGAGYLKLQMFFCVLSPILFIALCVLFIKYMGLGVWSILLSNLLANVYGVIVAPIQCYLVFFKNKGGILIR